MRMGTGCPPGEIGTPRVDTSAMSEHEVSRVLSAPSAAAFAVAADLERLPEWLPTVQVTAGDVDGEVRVAGESKDGPYESEGVWRPQPDQLRVEWGSESRGEPERYAGWLQVADSGTDSSEVTIHLSFFDDSEPTEIEPALESCLEALAGLVEG
jgi:uncharacterized protein YndB with AHSA1/START domain